MIHKFTLLIVLALVGTFADSESLHASDTVKITLRSNTLTVAEPELSIGDICEISGGSIQLRRQIEQMDVDVVTPDTATKVSRQQIVVRLVLAGIPRKSVQVLGPDSVVVNMIPNEKLQQRIESKIEAELSSQFGIALPDVRVRLLDTEPLKKLRNSIDTANFKTLAYFPSQLPLGDRYIQLEAWDTIGNRVAQKLHVQIVVLQNVFVTSGVVSKGTVITASHVQNIKRPIMDSKVELAGSDCLGCVASRDIAPHEVVTTRHLSRRPVRKQMVVKRSDLVDIVLIQGPLQVRLKNAKVMSSGGIGDVVRVLNTNSNKQLNAVVKDRTTVVVRN